MAIGKQCVQLIGAAILVLLLGACSTVNHKLGAALNLDTDLKLQVIADDLINPDEQDQASPVFIRLYELTSTKVFDKADFIDLYERDEEILGATLLAKQELKRVVPGAARSETFVLNKDTRYVALFAEFYRYKDAKTKTVFPVTVSNVVRNSIVINVSGTDLSWKHAR